MKVVHNSLKESQSIQDWMHNATELERSGEPGEAARLYEKVIGLDPVNEHAYDRLLIIYRKEKEYKKELAVVKKGIKSFEDYYQSATKREHSRSVAHISNALMKSLQLADKKGKPLYPPEPIGKWSRRKLLIEKRLKKP